MVSLSNVLTVLAAVWFILIIAASCCATKDDTEMFIAGVAIIVSLFFGAILLYRLGNIIFAIIGG
jgi:hypothetical protein